MEPERKNNLLKYLLPLTNLWPAALVVMTVMLVLPNTLPVLKTLPERLVFVQADASNKKPALPDPLSRPEKETVEDSGNTYEDGVYTGSSRGYGGDITVQVTVKEKKIAEVVILSASGETGSYLSRARKVIDTVIQAQTWEVDTISGATYSSRGILGAIRNALTGEKVENGKPPAQPKPTAPLKKEPFDDSVPWKDGVYTGSAKGFGGTIKVEVTITGGKIAKIRVLSHSGETDSYFNKAKKVIGRIISAGTPNVDTISGATYSSNGIINAVKDALRKAAGDSSPANEGADKGGKETNQPPADETPDPDLTNGLKNGTYTTDVACTDGNLFNYNLHLTMIVSEGRIKSIDVVKTNDTSDNPSMNDTYIGYAVSGRNTDRGFCKGIVTRTIEQQSLKDIDVVSGATYSSKAVIRGIKQLLGKAARDKKTADNTDGEEEDKNNQDRDRAPGNEETQPEEDEPIVEDGLKDGTYTLEEVCTDDPDDPLFDYNVRVTMLVEDGAITKITAERTEDRSDDPDANETFFGYAVNGRTKNNIEYKSVISQILGKQSTKDVDMVSGATYSSKTIVRAVRKLLAQAAKDKSGEDETEQEEDSSGTNQDDEKDPSGGNESDDPAGEEGKDNSSDGSGSGDSGGEKEEDENQGSSAMADGSYTREETCTDNPDEPEYADFDYTLRVTTNIEGGKIVSVNIVKTEDFSYDPDYNDRYIEYAKNGRTFKGKEYKGVVEQILSAQSASGIDAVTGATYSSKAIIDAVNSALREAAEKGKQSMEDDPDSGEQGESGDSPDAGSNDQGESGDSPDAAGDEQNEAGDSQSGTGNPQGGSGESPDAAGDEQNEAGDSSGDDSEDQGETDDPSDSGEQGESGDSPDAGSNDQGGSGESQDAAGDEQNETGDPQSETGNPRGGSSESQDAAGDEQSKAGDPSGDESEDLGETGDPSDSGEQSGSGESQDAGSNEHSGAGNPSGDESEDQSESGVSPTSKDSSGADGAAGGEQDKEK